MKEDNVVEYRNPGMAMPVGDPLTEVLRQGARELLQQAVEAEVFLLTSHELTLDAFTRKRSIGLFLFPKSQRTFPDSEILRMLGMASDGPRSDARR